MKENYFSFCLYDGMTSKPIKKGNYIFQNFNNEIAKFEDFTKFDDLPFFVFHYIVDYNLEDLELFFRLAGFSAFVIDEIPGSIINHEVVPLFEKKYVNIDLSKVNFSIKSEEEAKEIAKEYIESRLGEGVISRFYEVKKAKLEREKELSARQMELLHMLENVRTEENKEEVDSILNRYKSISKIK